MSIMNKPNILFIMCDQMRYDAIGCNGNPVIKTPNLDRLAGSGINFSNCYTPDPICVPARSCITTGFYPHKCTGVKKNGGKIKEGYPLLGEELNKRGYETYAMGKLHYLPYKPDRASRTTHGIKTVELAESGRMLAKFDPEDKQRGIEDYHDYLHTVGWGGYSRGDAIGNNDIFPSCTPIPEEHFVDTWVADRALYHMERHLSEQPDVPFFMWASFPKPHSPYNPPYPYNVMYDPRDIPEPVGSISDIIDREIDQSFMEHWDFMWDKLSTEAKKVIKAHYYGLISLQDKQIGRLLDFLEKKGLRENTIVVYTADHGDMMGDFGLYFKRVFYEGSVKIPLMISYPQRIKDGTASNELVGLQDLLPTLLTLCGEPLGRKTDGEDLTASVMEGKPVREYYVAQCGDSPEQQYMVAGKEWKYIYHEYGGVEELFNLAKDPCELNNLAKSDRTEILELLTEMRKYLTQWCIENGDSAMIEGGKLKKMEKKKLEPPERVDPFGRRYY